MDPLNSNPVQTSAPVQPMLVPQSSSMKIWVVALVVAVLAAAAIWYYSTRAAMPVSSQNTAEDTNATSISAEFEQLPDDSAALNQDAAASAQTVGSF
jgi:hypothetical protein